MTRPTFALFLVLACASGCGVPDRAAGPAGRPALTAITICTSAVSATQALTVYAHDTGLFARYGLDASLVPVSGGSRAVPALTSGSVQFCVMAGGPAANAVLAGADLVVVGSLLDTYAYNFVAADSIKTAADLKGKAVGVSTPGSASAVAMDIALERLGLRPGDVTVLALGDYRQRFSAMEAGYIAGSIFDYPDAEIARQHGLRTLLDMTPLELPTLQIALVTTRAYLTAHRATVLQFVKAISHALAAIRHDRAGGIAALARHTGLDAREYAAVLDRTYTAVFQERLKSTPAISLDAARAALAEAARNHPKASPNGPEDLADLSIVEELTQSGFFAGLTP